MRSFGYGVDPAAARAAVPSALPRDQQDKGGKGKDKDKGKDKGEGRGPKPGDVQVTREGPVERSLEYPFYILPRWVALLQGE